MAFAGTAGIHGYSGAWPASYFRVRDALATFPDDNSIRLPRDRGIKYVLIHEAFYGRPRYAALTAAADRRTDLKEVFRAGGGGAHARIYRVEAP